MELFWTQITDAQPARPARTKAHGSAWGVSLLAYAARAVWGIDLPETAELPGGKPYFPACPQVHFSVSHTRTAALVAVSAAPVGADVEQVRPLHPAMARRLAQADCGDLQPFELWTLRESWFKLTGRGRPAHDPGSGVRTGCSSRRRRGHSAACMTAFPAVWPPCARLPSGRRSGCNSCRRARFVLEICTRLLYNQTAEFAGVMELVDVLDSKSTSPFHTALAETLVFARLFQN